MGGIRVADHRAEGRAKVIAPIFIMGEYRNRGYAQQAIRTVEAVYGPDHWRLDTVREELAACHLYEKLGYRRVGEPQKVRSNMTIVDYEK